MVSFLVFCGTVWTAIYVHCQGQHFLSSCCKLFPFRRLWKSRGMNWEKSLQVLIGPFTHHGFHLAPASGHSCTMLHWDQTWPDHNSFTCSIFSLVQVCFHGTLQIIAGVLSRSVKANLKSVRKCLRWKICCSWTQQLRRDNCRCDLWGWNHRAWRIWLEMSAEILDDTKWDWETQ